MVRECFIYGLSDPRTDEIRYVRKSVSGMTRPRAHLFPSMLRHHNRRVAWLKSLLKEGLKPDIVVLERANAESLPELEKLAIAHYRSMGFDLVNGTDGGEGCTGRKLSEDAKRRVSEARKGKHPSADTKQRMKDAQRARYAENPMPREQIQRMHEALSSRTAEEVQAHREKMRDGAARSNRARVWTEASRKKISDADKLRGARPPVQTRKNRG